MARMPVDNVEIASKAAIKPEDNPGRAKKAIYLFSFWMFNVFCHHARPSWQWKAFTVSISEPRRSSAAIDFW